jgi:hypothetical protein
MRLALKFGETPGASKYPRLLILLMVGETE